MVRTVPGGMAGPGCDPSASLASRTFPPGAAGFDRALTRCPSLNSGGGVLVIGASDAGAGVGVTSAVVDTVGIGGAEGGIGTGDAGSVAACGTSAGTTAGGAVGAACIG